MVQGVGFDRTYKATKISLFRSVRKANNVEAISKMRSINPSVCEILRKPSVVACSTFERYRMKHYELG